MERSPDVAYASVHRAVKDWRSRATFTQAAIAIPPRENVTVPPVGPADIPRIGATVAV